MPSTLTAVIKQPGFYPFKATFLERDDGTYRACFYGDRNDKWDIFESKDGVDFYGIDGCAHRFSVSLMWDHIMYDGSKVLINVTEDWKDAKKVDKKTNANMGRS